MRRSRVGSLGRRLRWLVALAAIVGGVLVPSSSGVAAAETLPGSFFVPDSNFLAGDVAYDHVRQVVYLQTQGRVLRYNAKTRTMLSPLAPSGADRVHVEVTPSASHLIVVWDDFETRTGVIEITNLATSSVKRINLPRSSSVWWIPENLAIPNDDSFFVYVVKVGTQETLGASLLKGDVRTGVYQELATGGVGSGWAASPSGDGSVIAYSNPLGTVRVSDGAVLGRTGIQEQGVASSPSGTVFCSPSRFYTGSLVPSATLGPNPPLGVAFHPSEDVLFMSYEKSSTNFSTGVQDWRTVIEVHAGPGYESRYKLDLKAGVPDFPAYSRTYGMFVSRDGNMLLATINKGVACVPTPRAVVGKVTSDYRDLPMAGAKVEIFVPDTDGSAKLVKSVTADESGRWQALLTSETPVRVKVSDPLQAHGETWIGGSSFDAATPFVPSVGGTVADSKLPLDAPGAIVGTVGAVETGEPVGGTLVRAYHVGASGPSLVATAVADADGAYQIAGLPAGTYRLGFTASGYADSFYPRAKTVESAPNVRVRASEPANCQMWLGKAPFIHGWVTDMETGAPLEGVKVLAFDAASVWNGGPQVPVAQTTTAADGTYRIPSLLARSYVIGFADTTGTYRDMTFPGRGYPVGSSMAINPDTWVWPVAEELIPLEDVGSSRVRRISGRSRYDTALEISRRNFSRADTVVVASGDSFPDALAAAPLAADCNSPILLVRRDGLPDGFAEEFRRLGAKDWVIVGGEAAVSTAAINRDADAAGIPRPGRIKGKSRYETAINVARQVWDYREGSTPFVVRGDTFADALSVGPFAYMEHRPIILTQPDGLPSDIKDEWAILAEYSDGGVIVVGGERSVSTRVLQQMAAYMPSHEIRYARIAGTDRFDTSARLASAYGMEFDVFGLASGLNYPDALAGGAAMGKAGGALLLTPPTQLHPSARTVLKQHGPYVMLLEAFGGAAGLSDGVLAAAKSSLGTSYYDIDSATGRITMVGAASSAPSMSTAAGGYDPSFTSSPEVVDRKADFEAELSHTATAH